MPLATARYPDACSTAEETLIDPPVKKHIPIAAEVPGCPPRPTEILQAILSVRDSVFANWEGNSSMKRTVDVNIPLGPIHPCFKEPARLKCEAKGERIVAAEVELGYMKKGIERIMKGRPWQEVMFLAERVCGICSVIHNMVFIEAMEQISGIPVPPRAAYLRVIANELDRMQSHLLANFSYCYTIEHETLGMYLLDLREQVMDELEHLTGARVTCAYIIPGGVRCDITRPDAVSLQASLDRIEGDLRRYAGMFADGPMIALRSRRVGILTQEAAQRAHAVGPTARASGITVDCRLSHPTYRAARVCTGQSYRL